MKRLHEQQEEKQEEKQEEDNQEQQQEQQESDEIVGPFTRSRSESVHGFKYRKHGD